MNQWTKNGAIERAKNNQVLQKLLELEPRLQPIIQEAIDQDNAEGYDRIDTYIGLRNRASELVGWGGANPFLRTTLDYDTIIHAIVDLLPPDAVDLAD